MLVNRIIASVPWLIAFPADGTTDALTISSSVLQPRIRAVVICRVCISIELVRFAGFSTRRDIRTTSHAIFIDHFADAEVS